MGSDTFSFNNLKCTGILYHLLASLIDPEENFVAIKVHFVIEVYFVVSFCSIRDTYCSTFL